jgi:hypothetical protein
MPDSVIDATLTEAKAHPYWIVGGVLALVGLIWFASSAKKAAPAGPFSFTYGPSDSQVRAGTALAIAQAGDQTALQLGTLQAKTQADTAQSYFGYLTTNSANGVTTAQASDAAAVTINAQNNNTALGTAGYATQVAMHGQDTALAGLYSTNATSLAGLGLTTGADVTKAGYAMQTTLGTGAQTLAGIVNTNDSKIRISTSQDYTSGVLHTIDANASMWNTRGSIYGQ